MKKKQKAILLCTIVFLIICCQWFYISDFKYFLAGVVYGNQVSNGDIIFSKDSGFYKDSFRLSIYAPTEEIYYTLDGSDPDKQSFKYEKPILIEDASKNPNKYCERMETTTSFLTEEVEEYSSNPKSYVIPKEPVDKCVTLKAIYYDRNGKRSDVTEKVYFVGFQEKSGYDGMNIISVVTDPENLFGYDSGIYVTGKTFDTWFQENKDHDSWELEHWAFWGANYRNKGLEWERECNIQIFNKERERVLSQNVGVRVQGGESRAFLPKSLNFYAREEYGIDKMYYDFWGTGYFPKRMTLSIGGGDEYTKIKDRLVSELAKDCNITTMNYEPYILFLNGEYWGVYHLTEKYDVQYIEYYYDVDRGTLIDDIIMIKNGEVETGVRADYHISYSEMLDFISNADMTDDENYRMACEILDMESFIDYFAVEGYIGRCGDWPDQNFALWRSRNVSTKPYEDGKWRWILFDVNSTAMGENQIELDAIGYMRKTSILFDNLCNNKDFQKCFSERMIEIADTVFEKERVNQKLTEYVEELEGPMENHFQRFFGTSNEKFYEEIEKLRVFFDNRRPYVMDSIQQHFGEEYLKQ